jgi:alginate biosynthesis protein AlgX
MQLRRVLQVLCLTGSLAGAICSSANAETLTPCHRLCPEAADPASYDSTFRRSFRVVVDGKDGWLFRSEAELIEEFGPTERGLADLRRLVRAFQSRGTRLVIVFVPSRGLMHSDQLPDDTTFNVDLAWNAYQSALHRLRETGAIVPDLTKLRDRDDGAAFSLRRDHHWSPDGARAVAEIVAEELLSIPDLNLPEVLFRTRRSGLLSAPGTLARAVSQICDINYPQQYFPLYETIPLQVASEEDDLFGEPEVPEVILIGTSFSRGARNFDFAGFLREFLRTDVINAAVAGGNYSGAMDQYLNASALHETNPKLLIWEITAHHAISKSAFYQQAIPGAYGGCLDEPVLSTTTRLADDRVELVSNARDGRILDIRHKSHIVELQFEHREIRDFRLQFLDLQGLRYSVRIERNERIANSGRYVLELPRVGSWPERELLSVELTDIQGEFTNPVVGSQVTTRICRHPESLPRVMSAGL